MSSAAALTAYLDLLSNEANFGHFQLRTHDLSEYLRLDHAALRALSLFPDADAGASASTRTTSVFGLLNRCKTSQGTRMLAQWLKQPLVNVHAIDNRQSLVQVFFDDLETREKLQDTLKYMPDMQRISKRFQRGNASLEDVVRCYQAVVRVPDLMQTLRDVVIPDADVRNLFESTFLCPFEELQGHLSKLVEMVEITIDLDELAYHNFVIKADFDERLKSIKEELDQTRDKLDEQHMLAGKDLKMDTEKKLHLENHSTYGYCLRVTRADAGVLKNRKQYLELGTVKGGVHFTTATLRELNENFSSLSNSYARTQSSLVKDVIEIASSYTPPLEQLNYLLAHLDVINSLALVSSNAPIPYTRPKIAERGAALAVHESRHPCLEAQDDIHFIPNEASFKPGESEFLIVTGPNMGGKSTYLRQLGIIVLMAQIGCFVPAAEGAIVAVCDCILARVGAGDSQLKGVSTFMAEMLETATILKTATKDSLILIDELGRGTSTYDGFGLAWSISEWIVTRIHSKCVFATHFHELTELAQQQPAVKNLHVVAHVSPREGGGRFDRDITLLYRVEPGTSDQSYGIQIAELADFPKSVIRLAKRKAEELEGSDDSPSLLAMQGKDTDEGIALVNDFLRSWAERCKRRRSDAEDDMQVQMSALQSCVEAFAPRFQTNVRPRQRHTDA